MENLGETEYTMALIISIALVFGVAPIYDKFYDQRERMNTAPSEVPCLLRDVVTALH
ncbi:hypothetical protein AGMMS49992_27320 [Clostridia bacterium]|nr:hypothetical protein AGMMS49992_27320 [Clostridia bacterium]